MPNFSREKILRHFNYEPDGHKFIYREPPRLLFNNDRQWRAWCHTHVGKTAAEYGDSHLCIFDQRAPFADCVVKVANPPQGSLRNTVINTLLQFNYTPCDILVDSVLATLETCEPSLIRTRRALTACLTMFRIPVEPHMCLIFYHVMKSHADPWRGRRAGKGNPLAWVSDALPDVGSSVVVPCGSNYGKTRERVYNQTRNDGITVGIKMGDGCLTVTRKA